MYVYGIVSVTTLSSLSFAIVSEVFALHYLAALCKSKRCTLTPTDVSIIQSNGSETMANLF